MPSPGDLLDSGIKPGCPALQADSLPAELPGEPTGQESRVQFLGREDPLEKGMATHSSILPGESHGQRSLAGYSPRGHRVGHD